MTFHWKQLMTLVAAMTLAVSGGACGGDGTEDGAGGSGGSGGGTSGGACDGAAAEEVVVSGAITTDTTWCAATRYTLDGTVTVKNGATLTVEAGTVVEGRFGASLLVTRGAKLEAVGTATAPIVFTAADPDGDGKLPGDWGGVILLGRARINTTGGENSIEGFPAGASEDIQYGGDDDDDDSGTLRFVRIEWAGFEFAPDEEINGLTLGGVGRGTVLDHIQVHGGSDDGIEFFGGTVDAKHLVVSRPDDDGIDWDLGYRGRLQFVVVQQESQVGNRGFECDNDGSDPDKEPRSNPTVYNVTLIGSGAAPGTAGKKQVGLFLTEGTRGTLRNFVVANFADFTVDIGDAATGALVGNGLTLENFIVHGNNGGDPWNNESVDDPAKDGGFDEGMAIGGHATFRYVDPDLEAAGSLTAPNFMPQAGSPALTGGATPPSDGFFDPSATYVGAFGTENWIAGWTAFPEPAAL